MVKGCPAGAGPFLIRFSKVADVENVDLLLRAAFLLQRTVGLRGVIEADALLLQWGDSALTEVDVGRSQKGTGPLLSHNATGPAHTQNAGMRRVASQKGTGPLAGLGVERTSFVNRHLAWRGVQVPKPHAATSCLCPQLCAARDRARPWRFLKVEESLLCFPCGRAAEGLACPSNAPPRVP
jgi:hypothetical protein